jgi:hypothetical protein
MLCKQVGGKVGTLGKYVGRQIMYIAMQVQDLGLVGRYLVR